MAIKNHGSLASFNIPN